MNFILAESNDKYILTEKEFTLNIEPNDNLSLNIEPVEILINNTSFSNEVLSAYNYFSNANIERLSVTTNKQKRCIICIHFRANHQRSESAIKAEQAAKEVLIICERNQTTLNVRLHDKRYNFDCTLLIYPINSEIYEVIDAEVELQNHLNVKII
ncbi:unnamed protein product [Rhizophagus irregularis]|nr:unnamed protein product [Rhizophagus irregularis]